MAKWKTVGRVRKSKDREGNIQEGRFYLEVLHDIPAKSKISLFKADHSRLEDLVASGKMTAEVAEAIAETVVYELSVKTEDNQASKPNKRDDFDNF